MRWDTIVVDEGQEFLLTKDYLMQCYELFPNDYRIHAYNELREALEQIDWHLFMTLTFDNPIYDLHHASIYAGEFLGCTHPVFPPRLPLTRDVAFKVSAAALKP